MGSGGNLWPISAALKTFLRSEQKALCEGYFQTNREQNKYYSEISKLARKSQSTVKTKKDKATKNSALGH